MKTTVWIRLDIEVKPGAEDPFKTVDTVLDAGVLQDEINGIDVGLVVTSALSMDPATVEASVNSDLLRAADGTVKRLEVISKLKLDPMLRTLVDLAVRDTCAAIAKARGESATDNGTCSYCEAQGHHKDGCANPRVRALKCDGTNWGPCSGEVSMLDRKGYAYCETHGRTRRANGVACRKLRPNELRQLQRGQPLKSYEPEGGGS